MAYKTNSGKDIADADLDAMAEEYEQGTWAGVGKISPGRPRIYEEDMETVSFRLPKSRIAAVDAYTKRAGISKSQFFRDAIDKALLSEA